jgi:hypothetical protein
MAHKPDTTGMEPLEVDWFRDTITVVQLMELSRSTRADIDARTIDLVSHLRELLAEDLGAEQDDEVMKLFRQSYRLLELSNRPTAETSAYAAFAYMGELATLTFALLKVYVAKREDTAQ